MRPAAHDWQLPQPRLWSRALTLRASQPLPVTMPQRRPFTSLPWILIATGIGVAGWYGQKWYEAPRYSEAEIDASVELNLAIDLQRRGPALQPDEAGLARMRRDERDEVTADVDAERRNDEAGVGAGLIMIVAGLGNLVLLRLISRET
jgi:hypothetical protein